MMPTAATPPRPDALPLPDAPYRGIESLRFIDQQIFAARDEETWTLLSNITLYRAVLFYGASGTGKSSLINAGLLPRALLENYVADRLRVQPFAGREIKVERIRRSDSEQGDYLPSNFNPEARDEAEAAGTSEGFELSLTAFRQQLRELRPAPPAPAQDADALFLRPPDNAPRPLLIFDQFEEFITLFEEVQRGGGQSADARWAQQQAARLQRRILVTLIKLIRDDTLPLKIIFVFREDYLARLQLLFEHCPELLDQAQRLLPPHVSALPRIIRAPFTDPALRAHFLRQSGHATSELSQPLAELIAAQLAERSEDDRVNLTELQIVCERLWRSAEPDELLKQRGIKGLLKDYAAEVLNAFPEELRVPAGALLARMLTASNTRNIVSTDDLIGRTSEDKHLEAEQLHRALDHLARSQLVRREVRRNIYFYEITSEYLVDWIKELAAERKAAEQRHQAEEERRQAEQKLASEQRRARKLRALLLTIIVLASISVGVSVFAFWQWRRAVKAEQQTEQVLNALRLASSQNKDESLRGIAQIDRLIKENKLPSELKRVLITTATTARDEEVQQAASNVLAQAAQTDQELAEQLPPRLFIQIADEEQREIAQQLAATLKKKGYIVPGIQNVGGSAPVENELRYFRQEERDGPAIVTLLNEATGAQWAYSYNPGFENSPNVSPGYFEIWFARPGGWLRIKGIVDEDGKPLRGLRYVVTISNLSGEVIQQKRSQYFPLPPGDYVLSADADGYQQVSQQFSIKNGQDSWLVLRFIKKQG